MSATCDKQEVAGSSIGAAQTHFPKLKCGWGKTPEESLRSSVNAGLKYAEFMPEKGKARNRYEKLLEAELDAICMTGFCSYFVLAVDIVETVREDAVTRGRRSPADRSMVAYGIRLGVTHPKITTARESALVKQLVVEGKRPPVLRFTYTYQSFGRILRYLSDRFHEECVAVFVEDAGTSDADESDIAQQIKGFVVSDVPIADVIDSSRRYRSVPLIEATERMLVGLGFFPYQVALSGDPVWKESPLSVLGQAKELSERGKALAAGGRKEEAWSAFRESFMLYIQRLCIDASEFIDQVLDAWYCCMPVNEEGRGRDAADGLIEMVECLTQEQSTREMLIHEVVIHTDDQVPCDVLLRLCHYRLSILERIYGPMHITVASQLYTIENLEMFEKRYGDAEAFMRRDYTIRLDIAAASPEEADLNVALEQLAKLYKETGQTDKHIKFLTDLVESLDERWPSRFAELPEALVTLGGEYAKTGSNADAAECYQRALKNMKYDDYPASEITEVRRLLNGVKPKKRSRTEGSREN